MDYKAFVRMNIAIVGSEKMTATLAQGLAIAGHEIFIGLEEEEQIQLDFLIEEFDNIYLTTIENAAAHADLIIMATTPEKVREAAYLLDDVRKKVIIDITYMNCTNTEKYLDTLSAIKSITGSQFVVKCFNAAGFEPLPRAVRKDNAINMFFAGDNRKAKEVARLIARDLGYAECYDFGGSDSVFLLDEMAICYHHLAARKMQGEKIAIRITKEQRPD